ncbi:MAG: universal stress protein [Phycisphaerales bacterium]|nr:MAG: universal stress protein [Phycisphaerales bacterium]
MFERVLIGIDLSPSTDALLAALPRMRDAGVGSLTLAHVIPVSYVNFAGVSHEDRHRAALEEKGRDVQAMGFACDTVLRVGDPAVELLAIAEEIGATLLVMGSRGQNRLEEFFLGSVATQVLRHATLPVLVTPIGRDVA